MAIPYERLAGLVSAVAVDLAVQPRLRLGPITLDGASAHAECRCCFILRQAAKEPAFHDLRLSRIEVAQMIERFIERDQELRAVLDCDLGRLERNTPKRTASLECPDRPRVVDENVPHRHRGDRHELALAGPLRAI